VAKMISPVRPPARWRAPGWPQTVRRTSPPCASDDTQIAGDGLRIRHRRSPAPVPNSRSAPLLEAPPATWMCPTKSTHASPAGAQERTQVRQTLSAFKPTLIVKVGIDAQPAEGPLAGSLADAAASADSIEAGRSALAVNALDDGIHCAGRHHFALAQQQVAGAWPSSTAWGKGPPRSIGWRERT